MKSFWQNKRVFVTGHTGFKGAWLVKWLDMMGAVTMGYALPADSFGIYNKIQFKNHKSILADIRSADRLSSEICAFEPEIVFHLAAQAIVSVANEYPAETFAINTGGTVNLLETLRKISSVKSVVIVTSDKVYENIETFEPYTENSRLGGSEPYSASKACAELAVSAYRNAVLPSNIGIATARAANVYGGGDLHFDRLIPYLIKMKLENKTAEIRNKEAVRPWQHVLSPLHGYLLLAQELFINPSEFSEGFNFGPPEDELFTVGEIAKMISGEKVLTAGARNAKSPTSKVAGFHKTVYPNHLLQSNGLDESSSEKKFFESNTLRINSDKSRLRLKWKSVIDIQTGLESTIEFYNDMFRGEELTDLIEKTIGSNYND